MVSDITQKAKNTGVTDNNQLSPVPQRDTFKGMAITVLVENMGWDHEVIATERTTVD